MSGYFTENPFKGTKKKKRRLLTSDHEADIARLTAERDALRAEAEEWRDCAQYDPLMNGPRFKGWNRSALDRCRKQYIEARVAETVDASDLSPDASVHAGSSPVARTKE